MNPTCPAEDQLLAVAMDEPNLGSVRQHVDQCSACQHKVKEFRGEVAELRSVSQSLTSSDSPKPGRERLPNTTAIGRYVVVANLGSGGQADVYRVIDPNLERQLVLKLSHRKTGDDGRQLDALLAEGRLLADLNHPGLIRVFDVGIYDGRPYLVLEHVPGRNLEQIYADKLPTPQDAARLMAEVTRVVVYLHRRGIVHGDISPRNILIDAQGQARLIDFGLSKMEDAWGEQSLLLGGTLEFLPPEIAPTDGRLGEAGPASDVFGIGATLYWLLTGQPPFMGISVAQSLDRARRCDVDFGGLSRARVPTRIARICRQSMAAVPAERPAPQSLAEDLQRATQRVISRRMVVGALMTAVVAGAAAYVQFNRTRETETVTVLHGTPTVSVFRRDGARILSNELPLRTGDRLAVWCNISRGHEAIVLWFNPQGELKKLTPVRDVADKVDRMVYPAPRKTFSLEAPEGTELVFFCRNGNATDEELRACFPTTSGATLPPLNWLTLLRSEVKVEGPLPDDVPDAIVQIEGTMKQIDRQLRRYYQGVTGLAFPHEAAESTTTK